MDTDEGPLINENSNGLSHLLTDGEFNSVDAVAVDESSASNQAFLNAVELSAESVGDYLESNAEGFNTNDSFGDITFPTDSLNNALSDCDSRLSDTFKPISDTDADFVDASNTKSKEASEENDSIPVSKESNIVSTSNEETSKDAVDAKNEENSKQDSAIEENSKDDSPKHVQTNLIEQNTANISKIDSVVSKNKEEVLKTDSKVNSNQESEPTEEESVQGENCATTCNAAPQNKSEVVIESMVQIKSKEKSVPVVEIEIKDKVFFK